jgi:3-oxoadipate enol-lactonase
MAPSWGKRRIAVPRLRIRDIELYYETVGEGPPVLLIHGLGSSARDWELQIPAFSQHHRVVVYDVRGHGQSDKPLGPYSVPLLASDAAELMTALEIAPAHVVGISMGGMIAFQVALSQPALVKSLVIVNSGPELIPQTVSERLQVVQRQLVVRLLGMRRMGEILGQRMFPKPEQEELRRAFVERWAENDPRAYLASVRAVVGWSVADRLEEIGCPALIVAADQDYRPLAEKEACAARMPHAELVVIEDSRHGTTVDQPEAFNAAVLGFLARQG